ncbi:MAG TPA: aldehyde ferredoxin oxidoreductase family protein [Thermoanaerobaculia bacterium]|nr:aldehyde ferredoxin oxidoreductase family protein [Thermoanaerobaculia bacterium]
MNEKTNGSCGMHGRALVVDLSTGGHTVEEVPEQVYSQFLGGYGLGAWLMWKHFPPGTDALAPEACFAIVSGLLTGVKTPFSGRIQIVGKSPLTGTWADSNSGGSVAIHLRNSGFDALVVKGRPARPTLLVIRDGRVSLEPAGELWGRQIPEVFDAMQERFGTKFSVGVSAIGPAGEGMARIASVMNDRYHAFGRQGFGAIYGSKNLKAIVVGGKHRPVPIHDEARFRELCEGVNREYRRDIGPLMRLMVAMAKPKRHLGWLYRMFAKRGIKIESPQSAMRQLWSDRGTTAAVALSVENGDAPIKNWRGVGSRDFPLSKKGWKLDGAEVDKILTKKLSCGDCPAPCKGIVAIGRRGLSDVRRPDYETIVGFGANLDNDDLETVTACHDACNRYGMDAVSSSATLAWVCEAMERGVLTADDLDGVDMRWGDGEAALALTVKMGEGEGCGAWLRHGSARAAAHLGRGSAEFAVHVHGQEPAYHDPRFTSLMGVTYIADPTPGRHTAGSASWNETFGMKFPLPAAAPAKEVDVAWKGTVGKGVAQAHFSNAHQTLNGLGLCMFTGLTGGLPWVDLVNALTGWRVTERDLLECGERIQNLRHAFNVREGLLPADFAPHPRMMGQGDGLLDAGPLAGVTVPLEQLKRDYYDAMGWDAESGRLARQRAEQLGISELLQGQLA